jgi:hypothetical protein
MASAPTIIADWDLAMQELVITPLADHFGITGESVEAEFDVELIAENFLTYDSINGNEGFRVAHGLNREDLLRFARNMLPMI